MSKCPIPWNQKFDKNKKYIWISETGKNTCEECKSLDGKIFSGDKVPLRPHPNCKCEVKEYTKQNIVDDFLVAIANKDNSLVYGKYHAYRYNQPEAYNFFKIAVDKETSNQDYINKNAYLYSNIEKLNDKRKQKEILKRIHSEMPNLNDCQVFLFKQDSSVAEKIAKSDAIKNFLIKNMQNIRIFGVNDDTSIEFQSNDSDLYATLHGADIKNIRFDKERKNILCTIEDFYNFNPNRTSVKGRIGYRLQKQGDLIPFYVIINVKIPKSVWDKYKI
ncbi:hypothetical protein IJG14_00250 [bacterium]|nr:hypothetical protein [bacterium]